MARLANVTRPQPAFVPFPCQILYRRNFIAVGLGSLDDCISKKRAERRGLEFGDE